MITLLWLLLGRGRQREEQGRDRQGIPRNSDQDLQASGCRHLHAGQENRQGNT